MAFPKLGALLLAACLLSRSPFAQAQASRTGSSVRFEETYVRTPDGVRLYVRIVGDGPDTVVIGAAVYLAADLAPLQRGRTLIFYDPRSRGGSDAVSDPARMGIPVEVGDIEAVRSHFRLGRFSLIGWSYLGAVVALYAAEYPNHVRSVVQIGPMGPRAPAARPTDRRGTPMDSADVAYLALLRQQGMPTSDPVRYCREFTLRQLLRPMMGRPEAAVGAKADPCIYWNEWPTQLFATIGKVMPPATMSQRNYTQHARRITAPVLIVHGTNDPNARVEAGREWAAVIPRATLVELPGIGHGPWLEAPEEFFRVVEAFLSGR